MDRNRERRRGTVLATANRLSRRRQRSDEHAAEELQEPAGVGDRGSNKERGLDRDLSCRSKRRTVEGSLHDTDREGDEERTEQIGQEGNDDDCPMMAASFPMMSPPVSTMLAPNNQQKKNFQAKVGMPSSPWEVPDKMIGFPVPRKARSVSVKRSHECGIPGGGNNGGEPIPLPASTSLQTPTSHGPPLTASVSTLSFNPSAREKMKPVGIKKRPPKVSKTASIQESEIEIEVAEVLFGLTRQFPDAQKQETAECVSQKLKSKDSRGSNIDKRLIGSHVVTSSHKASAIAPRRKRPRPVNVEESSANCFVPEASASSAAKIEADEPASTEVSSPKLKEPMIPFVDNGFGSVEFVTSQTASLAEASHDTSDVESEALHNFESLDVKDANVQMGIETQCTPGSAAGEEFPSAIFYHHPNDSVTPEFESAASSTADCTRGKFKIDLMASPNAKSSPERAVVADLGRLLPLQNDSEPNEIITTNAKSSDGTAGEEKVGRVEREEESPEELDLEKQIGDGRTYSFQREAKELLDAGDILQDRKQPRCELKEEKAGQATSLPLPTAIANWPGLCGSSRKQQPSEFFFIPCPNRCSRHLHIARIINYRMQLEKLNPFRSGSPKSPAALGNKSRDAQVNEPSELASPGEQSHGSFLGEDVNNVPDQSTAAAKVHLKKDENSPAMFIDSSQNSRAMFVGSSQRKHLMFQKTHGISLANTSPEPDFVFPPNQRTQTAVTASGAVKHVAVIDKHCSAAESPVVTAESLPPKKALHSAMLQSNGYSFPLPIHVGPDSMLGGIQPPLISFFNGSLHPHHMLHPSLLQPAASMAAVNQVDKPEQGSRSRKDRSQPQAFSMSFATNNGAAAPPASGLDFSTVPRSQASLQSIPLPETTGRWYPIPASAASSPVHQKNYGAKERKSNSACENEKKTARKTSTNLSSNPLPSTTDKVSSITISLGNSVLDSSSRASIDIPSPANSFSSALPVVIPPPSTTRAATAISNSQQRYKLPLIDSQQQQLLLQQLAAQVKSGSSNANAYSDRNASAMTDLPNSSAVVFQQLNQSSVLNQPAQWRPSAKTGATPNISSPGLMRPTKSAILHNRSEHSSPAAGQTQISFGGNAKFPASLTQCPSSNIFSLSTAAVGGSPPSSVSRSAGSSSNTACGSKGGLSAASNSTPLAPNLGNLVRSAESPTVKQTQHYLQQQQQLQKHFLPAQGILSSNYRQPQSPQVTTASATSGFYQKWQSEQQHVQQPCASSSMGVPFLCSPPLTCSAKADVDPTKAVNNLNSGLLPQAWLHSAQFSNQAAGNQHLFISSAIPFIHSMPGTGVPVKLVPQKPAAGNDNLRAV